MRTIEPIEPIAFAERPRGSPWTMPTFYLAPLMCAYLLGAMWIVRGVTLLRRMIVLG